MFDMINATGVTASKHGSIAFFILPQSSGFGSPAMRRLSQAEAGRMGLNYL